MPKLIAEKKLQWLVCGPYHKKVWGNDGYADYNGWCRMTKQMLMQPGKPDVGALGCSADAKTVGKLPSEFQSTTEERSCNCPNCGVGQFRP